jgi:hypothetical protein
MNIEHELREALRRKQAPADLADRVLQRLHAAPARSARSGSSWMTTRRWLAAAAVFTITVVGGERYYTQQKAAEAAGVQALMRLAMLITN